MRQRSTLSSTQQLSLPVRLFVVEFLQDDPTKCTAARLRKLKLAERLPSLRQVRPLSIVLNPDSQQVISSKDRAAVARNGLVAIDCSWNRSEDVFVRNIPGQNRRLPTLIAGNPTNYSVRGKLSTAEAFAAALFITGFEEEARQVLSPFRWGDTFLTLNEEPLRAYADAKPEEIPSVEASFF